MSVEMRKKIVTYERGKGFNGSIFTPIIFEFCWVLKRSILSASISSGVHTISTSFPLRRV